MANRPKAGSYDQANGSSAGTNSTSGIVPHRGSVRQWFAQHSANPTNQPSGEEPDGAAADAEAAPRHAISGVKCRHTAAGDVH